MMFVGMSWVLFLGLAFVILSDSIASRRPLQFAVLLVCLAGAVLGLLRGSRAFSRAPVEWWVAILLSAVWLWGVVDRIRKWQADRRLKP